LLCRLPGPAVEAGAMWIPNPGEDATYPGHPSRLTATNSSSSLRDCPPPFLPMPGGGGNYLRHFFCAIFYVTEEILHFIPTSYFVLVAVRVDVVLTLLKNEKLENRALSNIS